VDTTANQNNNKTPRPETSWLHPRVYEALVGLAVWFVLAVWSFVGAGVTDYLLFIVSGFIFVAVALQVILSRVGRAQNASSRNAVNGEDKPSLFRDWKRWDFDTWTGPLSTIKAMTQILLPFAAAAVGMTAFGIVFHLVEHGAM